MATSAAQQRIAQQNQRLFSGVTTPEPEKPSDPAWTPKSIGGPANPAAATNALIARLESNDAPYAPNTDAHAVGPDGKRVTGDMLSSPELHNRIEGLLGLKAGDKNSVEDLLAGYVNNLSNTAYGNVKNDTVRGNADYNANGMSAARTARLARLADALNNKVYKKGATIGNLGVTEGGGVTGSAGSTGELYQMPKIETAETRQMEDIRKAAADRQKQEEARRQEVMGEAWRTNRITALEKLARQRKLTEAEFNEYKDLRYEEIRQKYSAPYDRIWGDISEATKKWAIDYGIKSYIADALMPLLRSGHFIEATVIGNLYSATGVMPSALDIMSQAVTAPLVQAIGNNASSDELFKLFTDKAKELYNAGINIFGSAGGSQ
jgi:hypothetical protein